MNDLVASGHAPLKILIVEDEPKLAQLLIDYLDAAGYVTQWLPDGHDVITQVKASCRSVVISASFLTCRS
jgi:two-component system response regulator BaeR